MNLPALSLLETRVLGVLVEKQHTVPDTYPLTLNALLAGCNQKTSRDPILNASEAEVQASVDHLRSLSLIVETSGGRVMRYAHNVERVLGAPSQAVALLAALMLRGPQTVAELRTGSERIHRFADISAVEGFLRGARGAARGRTGRRAAAPARHPRDPLDAPALGPAGCARRRARRPRRAARTTQSRSARSPRSGPTWRTSRTNCGPSRPPSRACARNWASRRRSCDRRETRLPASPRPTDLPARCILR